MRLVATSGDQTLAFPLRQGSAIIGRHPSCHICIPAKGVSRRHCQVYIDGDSAIIRDLGSANSTFINNQRVTERVQLHDGDIVALGNFQLRFEIAEDATAQAAYAEPGIATEGIILDAVPAQGHTTQVDPHLAEPGPEVAPPAPTDFPESPEPDDTPVDADFVPPPYAEAAADAGPGAPQGEPEAQPGALVLSQGVPMQPQLVVRDGHWYLRDPRTGREVEISPKGPSEPTAVMEREPTAARRPNTKLLIAAVAGAVVLVIGFAALFLKPPPGPAIIKIKPSTYYGRVDDAIKKVRKGEIEQALKSLDRVEKLRPDIGVARLIAQYVRLKKDTKLDEKFPWEQARNWLQSIEDTGSASDEALAYARKQLNWIHTEQTLIGELNEILEELTADDSIENLLEIHRKLAKFPDGYIASKRAKAEAERLRAVIAKHYLDRAKRTQGGRQWDEAIKHYQSALNYVDDKAPVNQQITTCQRNADDQKALGDAKAAVQNDAFGAARPLLSNIKPGSPYYDEARALLAQIEQTAKQRARQKLIAQARGLWKTGSAPEAIKLVELHGLDELADIKTRFEEWQRLMAQADAALKAKQYLKAQQIFDQAAGVIGDPQNAYAQQASARSKGVRGSYPQYAEEFAREGFKLIETKPLDARKLFDDALTLDNANQRAKRGLDLLNRGASAEYRVASDHFENGRYANALKHFERARDRAKPGGEIHSRSMQKIAKCKESLAARP